jgi:hypothetical protein
MTRIDKAELISYDQVKQTLRRALRDTSRIVNLPPLHASKIKVGFITIKNFSAKKTSDRIKVHGMGEVELHILYKNTEMGDIEFNEELPITYSAGFTHRKALLDCEAVEIASRVGIFCRGRASPTAESEQSPHRFT